MLLDMFQIDGLTAPQKGRLLKALDKLYQFDDESNTLLNYLYARRAEITHKTRTMRTHETHRRNLEYHTLAQPVTEYTVWFGDKGIDIPKMVWDSLVGVKER